MIHDAQLELPHRAVSAWRSLVRRIALSVGIILVIAVLAWLDRDGYDDADGTPLSFLDAVYYATVTATTTGYGDIAPVTPRARAMTAFLVTPLRVLFLIVLVGTTIELLTERFRHARAVARWRSEMQGHVIVVGFGVMGASAVDTLLAEGGTPLDHIVVVDRQHEPAARARERGLVTVVGDATRAETLRTVNVERASSIVVACNRDDTATLVTLTARELNPTATIAAAVRESENAHLLVQSGATSVVLSSEAAGRLVGLSTQAPSAVGVLHDLLAAGEGLDLVQHPVGEADAGRPLAGTFPGLAIAVVRDGQRLAYDDADAGELRHGDVVVCVVGQRSAS